MSQTNQAAMSDDELREHIVRHEWEQFQQVDNEGGRANCQGNWPTFHQMRYSQFALWPRELLDSYAQDLDIADKERRNLLTEKYARMMESTAPEEYRRDIAPYLPKLGLERQSQQERIIKQQVAWAADFRSHYPKLGQEMRILRTADDTVQDTSFETYLRGELSTYSANTLRLYLKMVLMLAAQRRNLTEETLLATVQAAGYENLDQAEAAQQEPLQA